MKSFNEFFKQFLLEAEEEFQEEKDGSSAIIDYVLDDSLNNDFEAFQDDKEFDELLNTSTIEDIKKAIKELYEQHIESDNLEDLPEKKEFLKKVVNFLQEKVQN